MPYPPIVSFFILVLIFAIGGEISLKTKSVISLMLVSSILHLIGYWTGIIPTDSVASTGLPALLTAFALPIIITNLGTMIDLNQLLSEWKTVLICLFALVCMGFLCFTVGSLVFGREYALVASVPISGGSIATIIIGDACEAAGRADLAGFAALINSLQLLIGLPIGAYLVKEQLKKMQKEGLFQSEEQLKRITHSHLSIKRKAWKHTPAWWNNPYPTLARVTLIAICAYYGNILTKIPFPILCLVFGVIATQTGFLETTSLQNAGYWPFFMIIQLCNMPRLLANVALESIKTMYIPVFGMLILGALSLTVGSLILGRLLRVPWRMSAACGLCAMIGYPNTMLISEDAVATMDGNDQEKLVARGYVLPRMLVGGFTSVSLASVVFAGIVAPIVF